MWNPFRRRPLLSPEDREYIVACYQWFFQHFGKDIFYDHTQLVLPTRTFFPVEENWQEDVAYHLFLCVQEHAGMSGWPCRLVPQEKNPDPLLAPTIMVQGLQPGPAGTFFVQDKQQEVVISYDPALLASPEDLVATFAMSLSIILW